MNLQAIVTLLFVIGALWIAASFLIHKGVWSIDTWLGPVAIWVVAFLVLWIGNTFAMGPIQGQASGLAGQTTNLVNNAVPALNLPAQPNQPSQTGTGGNTTFGGDQSGNTTFAGSGDQGSTTVGGTFDNGGSVVVAPQEITPPQVGELRWGGSLQPPYNDNMIPMQAGCFANQQTMTTMLSQGYVPSGMQVQIVPGATFWHQPEKETWSVRVIFPHQQLPILEWVTDGMTARAMKKALGGETASGSASWPLVKQSFDGTNWITIQPVECQYR